MRQRVLLAVTTIAITACAAAHAQQPEMPALSQPSTPAVSAPQPDNAVVAPRSEAKSDVQQLLAQLVEATVSKGDGDKLVSYFSKPARDQIGQLKEKSWSDLDGRIDQFRKDWQAKYGQEFKLSDKQSVVFLEESFPIHSDQAKAASPNESSAATQPATESATQDIGASASQQTNTPRTVTVQLPAVNGEPTISLKLVNEGKLVGEWKLDIPGNVDANTLHDSLLNRLTALDENKASWPTEINEGYQSLSGELLSALAQSGQKPSP